MEYVVFFLVIAGIMLIIAIQGVVKDRAGKAKFVKGLRENYGRPPQREYQPEQYQNISLYFNKHNDGFAIDDITWNDLNMDEIFRQMNHTHSAAGEEYLYYTLRTPRFDRGELEKQEEKVRYFMEHEDERVAFQTDFAQLGRTGKYSIYNYLEYLDELGARSNAAHYLGDLAILASIALLFVSVQVGILALVIAICQNMLRYFKVKGEIDPYITSFSYIMRLLACTEKLEKHSAPALDKEFKELETLRNRFGKFRAGSYLVMSPARMAGSSNLLELLLDYLRMTFHLDLIKFNQMLGEVRRHIGEIDRMLTLIGSIETDIAIGAYRAGLSAWCVPGLDEAEQGIAGQGLYHPLIADPVKNNIRAKRGVLLTGSNASGKSTFLKTVAINAVLAQTIHTCLADGYRSGFYRVYSSMALRDDVAGGDSYYMVEIKSLKRILDGIGQEGSRILCFVDEVLRGTNTVERIAASTQILKNLEVNGVQCFAATHDVELTHLLEGRYDNYHFEEEIAQGDVLFNYRLMKGRATTRNAIRLLGVMGYEDAIIREAERMAEQFLRTGRWEEAGT